MPLSKDPDARSRQLANLRAGSGAPAGNGRALTHGAFSEVVIRAARERYLAELAEAFPSATHPELVIQAGRLAKLEALGAYTDVKGVIKHQRRGDVYPSAVLEEKIAAAYERQAAVLLAREQARPARPAESLESIIAELTAGEQIDQDGDQDGIRPATRTAEAEGRSGPQDAPEDEFDASDQGGA